MANPGYEGSAFANLTPMTAEEAAAFDAGHDLSAPVACAEGQVEGVTDMGQAAAEASQASAGAK